MKNYIYGAGGHGKVVCDAAQRSDLVCDGFVDDRILNLWMGLPVFSSSVLSENKNFQLHIAIGDCKIREKIATLLGHIQFLTVYHPNAVVSMRAEINEGVFLAAGSIIAPDVKVGKHSIVNHHAVVDHDCIVSDFCHIAPHVSLGGGVKVGEGVLIGAGAIILPGITIGDYATVGAGSIVTNDIASGLTVLGNPARVV